MVSKAICSCSAKRKRLTRSSGPRARSKGRWASSCASRNPAASPSSSPNPDRSITANPTHSAAAITCTGCPSKVPKLVRSDSCRRMISFRLCSKAPSCKAPDSRTLAGMLYAALPGSSWSKNQSRCCAKESAKPASRDTGRIAGILEEFDVRSAFSIETAKALIDGNSKRLRRAISTPNVSRTREMTCVAKSECPPNSKKLS